MGGMKGVNGCGQTAAQSGFRGLRGGGSWGNGRRAADGAAPRGRMPEGGRAERRERAEPEDEKKGPLESRRRGAERNEEQTAPVPAGRWPTARSGGRWVQRQETEMDLTETYMKRLASCAPHVGEEWGSGRAALRGAKPAAGVRPPRGAVARWTSRSVDRGVPQR